MSKPGSVLDSCADPYDDHQLMLAPVMQLVNAIPMSILWVVGETWVRCDQGKFFVDADEMVDPERVRQLLIDSGGNAYHWDEG